MCCTPPDPGCVAAVCDVNRRLACKTARASSTLLCRSLNLRRFNGVGWRRWLKVGGGAVLADRDVLGPVGGKVGGRTR